MSKTAQWVKENVRENEADIEQIGKLSLKSLYDQLSIKPSSPETAISVYGVIFGSIIDAVVAKEKEYSSFELNLADRLAIGYSTTSNEDDEKVGNFMVYLKNLESHKMNSRNDDDDEPATIVLAAKWNAANITTQTELIKEIASAAARDLQKKLSMEIANPEIIIPMFCIIHMNIITYLKLRRVELGVGNYEINFANLYTVGVQETDGDEIIYFQPTIDLKLKFKNDKLASGTDD